MTWSSRRLKPNWGIVSYHLAPKRRKACEYMAASQRELFLFALKGRRYLSRLGLIQHFVFSCLQVMFTNMFNCNNTIAF